MTTLNVRLLSALVLTTTAGATTCETEYNAYWVLTLTQCVTATNCPTGYWCEQQSCSESSCSGYVTQCEPQDFACGYFVNCAGYSCSAPTRLSKGVKQTSF